MRNIIVLGLIFAAFSAPFAVRADDEINEELNLNKRPTELCNAHLYLRIRIADTTPYMDPNFRVQLIVETKPGKFVRYPKNRTPMDYNRSNRTFYGKIGWHRGYVNKDSGFHRKHIGLPESLLTWNILARAAKGKAQAKKMLYLEIFDMTVAKRGSTSKTFDCVNLSTLHPPTVRFKANNPTALILELTADKFVQCPIPAFKRLKKTPST